MFQYVFSIVLIVASNVCYNITQKLTPSKTNPFVLLLITYLFAAAICAVTLIIYRPSGGIIQSLKAINWTSFVLGIAIVGLEFGYILAYRAGWNISIGSLVANICLAVLLVIVGVFFFKEEMNLNKVIGIILCISGLLFICRK
jgi:drug/metabolite transporter (DMT)-like permease